MKKDPYIEYVCIHSMRKTSPDRCYKCQDSKNCMGIQVFVTRIKRLPARYFRPDKEEEKK